MPGWVYKAVVSRRVGGEPMVEYCVVWENDPVRALATLQAAKPDLRPGDLEQHGRMPDEVMSLLGMNEGDVRSLEVRS